MKFNIKTLRLFPLLPPFYLEFLDVQLQSEARQTNFPTVQSQQPISTNFLKAAPIYDRYYDYTIRKQTEGSLVFEGTDAFIGIYRMIKIDNCSGGDVISISRKTPMYSTSDIITVTDPDNCYPQLIISQRN